MTYMHAPRTGKYGIKVVIKIDPSFSLSFKDLYFLFIKLLQASYKYDDLTVTQFIYQI